jgi:protein ImuA
MLDTVKEPARIAALRQRIARIEQGGRGAAPAVLPFGIAALDAALPGGGLARGALHEIGGVGPDEEDGVVPAAFIAGLCARLEPTRPILWCEAAGAGDLYGPGLAAHGLAPDRLIVARPRNAVELLWAMEEGLHTPALAAVVGEVAMLPGPASRRLQLAAEASGVTAFALRRVRVVHDSAPKNYRMNPIDPENTEKNTQKSAVPAAPNAAVTRWRVAALPGLGTGEPGLGRPRWRLDLWRVRGGAPAHWIVEACDATGHVALPAALGDGTARGGLSA